MARLDRNKQGFSKISSKPKYNNNIKYLYYLCTFSLGFQILEMYVDQDKYLELLIKIIDFIKKLT